MTNRVGCALLLGLLLPQGRAQAKLEAPAFEVASIRPAAPQTGPVRSLGGLRSDPARVTYTNMCLRQLLEKAYGVRPQQISGPGWIDSDRFDIAAKLPEGATEDRVPLMLRTLLAERFQLALRVEKKDMAIYALVAAKNGPKLEKSPDGAPGARYGISINSGSRPGWARITATNATLSLFADMLTRMGMVGRPVFDETGIEGTYGFSFEVSADEIGVKKPGPAAPDAGSGKGDAGPAPESAPAPSIFTAIQQIGLRLEPRKAPMDFIVIENGNRVPTEN